jgi:AcrR family transcriptional regulator
LAELTKSEETGRRILDSALELFRRDGFDAVTMRQIAEAAGVATGAAYYYFPSKEAIVMALYERSCVEMQPHIQAALEGANRLEDRLRALVQVKLDYFKEHRAALRALLRVGADPKHPLSPFSRETKAMRDMDVEWFRQSLIDCGVRIPKDIGPHLPEALWFFQMGIIYFWVIDESRGQARSARLLDLGARSVAGFARLSSLPLTRPLRKAAVELIELVKGD